MPFAHCPDTIYLGSAKCIPEMRPRPAATVDFGHEWYTLCASMVPVDIGIMYLQSWPNWLARNFQACKLDRPMTGLAVVWTPVDPPGLPPAQVSVYGLVTV